MIHEDELAGGFEAERPRLHRLAARILGNDGAADDAVQETWLRLARTNAAGEVIDSLPGWLTTVCSRICLDLLRSGARKHEDGWSAELDRLDPAPTPEDEAELVDAVGRAMTVVLDSLAPAERLAYVLRDVFAVPFGDIARILGRSEVATRQVASRARRRLQQPTAPDELDRAETAVVDAFMKASKQNEFDALLELLDPDAVVRSDATAAAMGTPAVITGARSAAEFFTGKAKAALPSRLDGAPGAVWQLRGEAKVVFAFTVVDHRIREIEFLADPGVLARSEHRRPLDRRTLDHQAM